MLQWDSTFRSMNQTEGTQNSVSVTTFFGVYLHKYGFIYFFRRLNSSSTRLLATGPVLEPLRRA